MTFVLLPPHGKVVRVHSCLKASERAVVVAQDRDGLMQARERQAGLSETGGSGLDIL